jgi:DNA polymerase type B, organellar and viral
MFNITVYGLWSSEELNFAKSKGFEVTVIKGYNFNKVENIFNDY